MEFRVKSRWGVCGDLHTRKGNFYMHACHGESNQAFYFETWPPPARIKSASGNKCLDYHTGNNNLYFGNCHSGRNQKFFFHDGSRSKVPMWRSQGRRMGTLHDGKCVDYGHGNLYMHSCHGGNNQKFYFHPKVLKQDIFVSTKLCGLSSDEPPDPPMCDVLQAGGESAYAVNKAMKGKGVAAFGFSPIPTFFGGEMQHGKPTFEQMYTNGHGMMFTQWGMDGRGPKNCGGKCDKCLHTRLFTTSVGCNVAAMPKGQEMGCLRFVRTKLSGTPYGPIDEDADVKCDQVIPDSYSGWCECQTAVSNTTVIHAVRSAVRNPIGKPYTCADECKSPTWIPAVGKIEMAYTGADFSKGKPDGEENIKPGKGAKCSPGFYDVEHLPVGSVGAACVNLQSDLVWSTNGGVKPPPGSKLCAKR